MDLHVEAYVFRAFDYLVPDFAIINQACIYRVQRTYTPLKNESNYNTDTESQRDLMNLHSSYSLKQLFMYYNLILQLDPHYFAVALFLSSNLPKLAREEH